MNPWLRLLPVLAALAITCVLAVLATVSGAYYFFRPGLPSAETLRDVQLQIPLRVYSRDGRLMGQIGEKRRIPVAYADIPDQVIQAFLAAEDDRFFEHPGFDYQGIMRAAVNLALTGSRSQGGSTITPVMLSRKSHAFSAKSTTSIASCMMRLESQSAVDGTPWEF